MLQRSRVVAPPVMEGVDLSLGWLDHYPLLVEFLSLLAWEDGKPRTPGSVILFSEEGVWKACVNDKDAALVAFVSARSPEGLLCAINDGLASGGLDWRKGRQSGSGKSRKGS